MWLNKNMDTPTHISESHKQNLSVSPLTFFRVLFFFFFWMWTIFQVFIEGLLQYCFCFMFWFVGYEVSGLLALQPRIELTPPALEGEILPAGLPGKSIQPLLMMISDLFLVE